MDQLKMVGLAERAHYKVKTYSQGMKQRLGLRLHWYMTRNLSYLTNQLMALIRKGSQMSGNLFFI